MATLVLTPEEVRVLLPMGECIEAVAAALGTRARGGANNPLRRALRLPGGRIIGTMPGSLDEPESLGLKVVGVFPQNHGTQYDAHQGIVMLLDPENGVPQVILDASAVTAIRTAAASAVATRLLANEDAGDLALIGSGVQGHTHLEAMRCVRDIKRVRVFSASPHKREAFAERTGAEAVASAREAVEGADIVCTTTSSPEPVVEGAWLAPGCHVNAVGACVPEARELDSEAMARARLYTDSTESLKNESGGFLIAVKEGAIGNDHLIGEIGDVLIGKAPGRGAANEITLFESLGIAVEDLAAAQLVYQKARAQGVGVEVELGGLRP